MALMALIALIALIALPSSFSSCIEPNGYRVTSVLYASRILLFTVLVTIVGLSSTTVPGILVINVTCALVNLVNKSILKRPIYTPLTLGHRAG